MDRLFSSPTTHAVELAARFAEERHRVLAENAANVDTPGYKARQLESAPFQRSLQEALQRAKADGSRRLELRDNRQFQHGPSGNIHVQPDTRPAQNVLFHDGTNASLEQTLSDIVANTALYDMSVSLLKGRFDTLQAAIRGRNA